MRSTEFLRPLHLLDKYESVRGSQYGSAAYRAVLAEWGLRGSMSRRGSPYDNARAESFIKTVKYEEVYLSEYETYQDVVDHVPRFLDQIYNEKRLHSALGYLSPMEVEAQHAQQAAEISLPRCPISGGHSTPFLHIRIEACALF